MSRLFDAGVLKKTDRGLYQFDHQLKHDYLASRFLAGNADKWSSRSFDIVTFTSNSFDALVMTLEQINDAERGDEFIKAIYDWNWSAIATCIADYKNTIPKHFSKETEVFALATVALKLFDPIGGTRQRSQKILSLLESPKNEPYVNAKSPEGIVNEVSLVSSDKEWFNEWKKIFTLSSDNTINENILNLVLHKDSRIGWAAANSIRRFTLTHSESAYLRAIYNARKDTNPYDNAIRWRIVHILGICSTEPCILILLAALDKDEYKWVKYGAARSLIEIAARSEDGSSIIKELIKRIEVGSLPSIVLEEIGRAVFFEGASSSWQSQCLQLLQIIRDNQPKDDQGKWEKIMNEITSFYGKEKVDDLQTS